MADFNAYRCANDHLTYPRHPVCPECGEDFVDEIDLTEETAEIVTWTNSTATPPGVREPNPLAVVEFDLGSGVRAIGQLTTDDVSSGEKVRPVYVEELRDPEKGIREPESHDWDGYRFEPVEKTE